MKFLLEAINSDLIAFRFCFSPFKTLRWKALYLNLGSATNYRTKIIRGPSGQILVRYCKLGHIGHEDFFHVLSCWSLSVIFSLHKS